MQFPQSYIQRHYKVLTLAWGLFIFILSFLPGSVLPKVGWEMFIGPDKWVHAFLYGIWILLFVTGAKTNSALWIACGMFLFGGGIELFQEYILTYRSGEWMDWVADGLGLMLGFAVSVVRLRKTKD